MVYLPGNISTAKMALLQQQGARIVQHGTDCVEAEVAGKAFAEESGRVWISPYNDLQVATTGRPDHMYPTRLRHLQCTGLVGIPL